MIDLAGQRFNRLTALIPVKIAASREMYWVCKCDCGGDALATTANLRRGRVRSCGCLNVDRNKETKITHGMTRTRTYTIWFGMKRRCDDPSQDNYSHYGGRGISYDPRWRLFANFFADMGKAPEGLQLDRIDNEGNYCKENCRWVTPRTNSNNRSNSDFVEYAGERVTVTELARKLGMKPITLESRLYDGWSLDRAIRTPVRRWTPPKCAN